MMRECGWCLQDVTQGVHDNCNPNDPALDPNVIAYLKKHRRDTLMWNLSISFAGPRSGMSRNQACEVLRFMKGIHPTRICHGGARGADTEFHGLAIQVPSVQLIRVRPSTLENQIDQWTPGTIEREKDMGSITLVVEPPERPHKRNSKVVDDGFYLLITPNTWTEQRRSGTWMTYQRAKVKCTPIISIFPSQGEMDHQEEHGHYEEWSL